MRETCIGPLRLSVCCKDFVRFRKDGTVTNLLGCNIKTFIEENFSPGFLDLDLFERALEGLREYCEDSDIEFDGICADYINRESSEDWRLEEKIHETESEELIRDYYSTTKMYLIELTVHESTVGYQNLFRSIGQFVKRNKVHNVLDFGAGIGGLAIYLRTIGICCDCADIPGETWNYARHRFQKKGVDVSQLTEGELAKLSSKYDLIVSLDCLEHLKPLPKYIALFNSALKINGFLLLKSTFRGKGLHLSSNYKYGCFKTFNRMMRNNGFVFNGWLAARLKLNFLIPPAILNWPTISKTSGRKVTYIKRNNL